MCVGGGGGGEGTFCLVPFGTLLVAAGYHHPPTPGTVGRVKPMPSQADEGIVVLMFDFVVGLSSKSLAYARLAREPFLLRP